MLFLEYSCLALRKIGQNVNMRKREGVILAVG